METVIIVLGLLVVAIVVALFIKVENERINDLHERRFEKLDEKKLHVNETEKTEVVKAPFHLVLEEALKNQQLEEEAERKEKELQRKRELERKKEIERQRSNSRQREVKSSDSRQQVNTGGSNSFYDVSPSYAYGGDSHSSSSDSCSSSSSSDSSSSYDSSSSSSYCD